MRIVAIILIIGLASLLACITKEDLVERNEYEVNEKYLVITIDSCEYIYVPNGNASWGTHKGNCNRCLKKK